ncbi:MAG TPA: aminoglycoside phosphotransferase family protein, partial [Acidimicrobiales bacterium]|nr:aminoglycoside phosphotransferase family protein [Acidimicrobiales bacterium]
GIHLPWANVPAAVKRWAATLGGGEPTDVRDLHGGFSPGAAARLECPRGALFVKAVGEELNPESPALHRREAVVSRSLPRLPALPVLLDVYDENGWVALAFDAIEGRVPQHPWDRAELDGVVKALEDLHHGLTPSPAMHLEPAGLVFQRLFGGWAELASAKDTSGLDPWCRKNLPRLAELEARWPEAIEGQTLVHGDVRSDNILIGPTGPVFVDWPHAAVGTPVFDLVAWAPSVVLEGGPQPEELLAAHGPSRSADPDTVSALLAAVSGFFVAHSLRPPPPGLPTLRPFQATQGEVALAWLRRRTAW